MDSNNLLDMLFKKLDKMDDRLDNVDKKLAVYNEQLKIHIEGVNLNREAIQLLDVHTAKEIAPIKKHVHMMEGALKLVGIISLCVGTIIGLIKLIQMV